MRKYNVAIVGIRGAVGQCMYQILKERHFPVNRLRLFSHGIAEDAHEEIEGIRQENQKAEPSREKSATNLLME